jgi:methylmalonyl-CoA/ethylmalonyl-CoA epimerase
MTDLTIPAGPWTTTLRPDIGLRGIGLRGIDHVGIAVPDLDVALAFYTQVLGLHCEHRETNPEQGVHEAMLTAGPPGGTRIQLLAPVDERSPIARFLDRRGPGLQQLAYTVTDVRVAAEVLRERGLELLYDVARRGTAGSLVNFIHPRHAGGVLVELVQPAGIGPGTSASCD